MVVSDKWMMWRHIINAGGTAGVLILLDSF